MGSENSTALQIDISSCPRRDAGAVTTTVTETESTTAIWADAVSATPSTEEEPLLPAEPEISKGAESATPYLDKEPLLPARRQSRIKRTGQDDH